MLNEIVSTCSFGMQISTVCLNYNKKKYRIQSIYGKLQEKVFLKQSPIPKKKENYDKRYYW